MSRRHNPTKYDAQLFRVLYHHIVPTLEVLDRTLHQRQFLGENWVIDLAIVILNVLGKAIGLLDVDQTVFQGVVN